MKNLKQFLNENRKVKAFYDHDGKDHFWEVPNGWDAFEDGSEIELQYEGVFVDVVSLGLDANGKENKAGVELVAHIKTFDMNAKDLKREQRFKGMEPKDLPKILAKILKEAKKDHIKFLKRLDQISGDWKVDNVRFLFKSDFEFSKKMNPDMELLAVFDAFDQVYDVHVIDSGGYKGASHFVTKGKWGKLTDITKLLKKAEQEYLKKYDND